MILCAAPVHGGERREDEAGVRGVLQPPQRRRQLLQGAAAEQQEIPDLREGNRLIIPERVREYKCQCSNVFHSTARKLHH